jgi:dienelactone hydrolase
MNTIYQHLGIYSDLVADARRQAPVYPLAVPGIATQDKVREVLGYCNCPEAPLDVRVEQTWERDGLSGERITWSVGYGPRTEAYLLRPAGATLPLPGIVALHDHGGFKFYGKEKIADGPDDPAPVVVDFRRDCYGGRAFANALAKEGFVVLIHDTFLWGSRKFPLEDMPQGIRDQAQAVVSANSGIAMVDEIGFYNQATGFHEHLVSKYCNLLGTSMAGVVSHEDRIAVNYLLSRPEVLTGEVGCMGLSGGGNRAALLQATHDGIHAAVIVGLMSTYDGLLDHNVFSHTWMFFPFQWARYGDWPDLAACRAPSPLLVQYDMDDTLFTLEGMRAADARLALHYQSVVHPEAYTGQFYPGPHKLDLEMQAAAFNWLKDNLGKRRNNLS